MQKIALFSGVFGDMLSFRMKSRKKNFQGIFTPKNKESFKLKTAPYQMLL